MHLQVRRVKRADRELEACGRERGGGTMAFTRPLLEHASESRRLFRALVGKRSSLTSSDGFFSWSSS